MKFGYFSAVLIGILFASILLPGVLPAHAKQSDFSISANPTSLSTLGRGSRTSTITLTSLNRLSGTVTVSSSSSPTGITTLLSPASVSLTSGGQATSVLTVTANGTTTP